jgi:hypothetical protein
MSSRHAAPLPNRYNWPPLALADNVKPTRWRQPNRYLIVTMFSGTTPNLAEWQARVKARYQIVIKFLGSGRKLPHEASPRSRGHLLDQAIR